MASFRCQLVLLAIALAFFLSSSNAQGLRHRLGNYHEVNPIDQEAVASAIFAIEEHNKEANKQLVFIEVIEAKRQVVSGFNDELVIEADDDGVVRQYEATVYVPPKTRQPRKLISMKLKQH